MQKFLIAIEPKGFNCDFVAMPFPKKPERDISTVMCLYGYLGAINPMYEVIARSNLYPTFPSTMSIADQKVWEEYISSQINTLNKISNNYYKYLHNSLDNSLSLGEIDGNNKIAVSTSFPLEMAKTAINLCTYSYLNSKKGDILDGFTILKIVEIYSWVKLYYLYAFIGVKKTADETVFCVVFRGTLNVLQWTADFMLAPHDEAIKIKGREFDIDYTSGFYKCVNDKNNNIGHSAFDTIMEYLSTHIGQNKGKISLLLSGHSAGASACNVFTLDFFQDKNQLKYGTLFNEINCITFGEGVSGRKTGTRLANQYILDCFPHFHYYTVVNNLDIIPCLNSVFYTGFHAYNKGYLIQYKDKALYKITTDTLAYGQFLNAIFHYLYHFLWLTTNIRSQILFFKILVLLFCYSSYNHNILTYRTSLDCLK